MPELGQIVILNGAPRSGKSSIATAIRDSFAGAWVNLGVDAAVAATPAEFLPGIGLRPGGERPDLEDYVRAGFADLYDAVAALSRQGVSVVLDVGHHDSYSASLGTLADAAGRLADLPAFLVGVRCPIAVVMRRRDDDHSGTYLGTGDDGSISEPVRLWQKEVHRPGIYDLEVDTSVLTPNQCADVIRRRIDSGPPPTALQLVATST